MNITRTFAATLLIGAAFVGSASASPPEPASPPTVAPTEKRPLDVYAEESAIRESVDVICAEALQRNEVNEDDDPTNDRIAGLIVIDMMENFADQFIVTDADDLGRVAAYRRGVILGCLS